MAPIRKGWSVTDSMGQAGPSGRLRQVGGRGKSTAMRSWPTHLRAVQGQPMAEWSPEAVSQSVQLGPSSRDVGKHLAQVELIGQAQAAAAIQIQLVRHRWGLVSQV